MVKIGANNSLTVRRLVDIGAYLDAGNGAEILLPAKYITSPLKEGDTVDVFVYTDSEDRPVATTEVPLARVGDFAYLRVADTNRFGAFLDWGIPSKQLLVPFSEQTVRPERDKVMLVYVYLDHASGRICGSAKINKFLGNTIPRYRRGQRVKALIYKHVDAGYKAIVDNLFHGFVYDTDLYGSLKVGSLVDAYVKQVRPDGKIDLLLSGGGDGRIDALAGQILRALEDEGGRLPLSDASPSDAIKRRFGCSKKDFKKAVGQLYRERKIVISDAEGISLVK